MKAKWALGAVIGLLGIVGVYVGNVLATPSVGQTTSTVAASSFDRLDLRGRTHPGKDWRMKLKTHGMSDFYVIDNKFIPGGTSGWHSHPGPSLIFVVAGEVTNYESSGGSCTQQVYSKGSAFVDEGGGDVHMLRNTGDVQAETIAVQFLPKGADRKIDEPDPGSC
jgi:quercetin dioxygenase-like cupin family protein